MTKKKNPRNEELIVLFGANVRKARKEKGLTMVELAKLCKVEYDAISTIERGRVNCTISTAYGLAKALDTSVDKLMNG